MAQGTAVWANQDYPAHFLRRVVLCIASARGVEARCDAPGANRCAAGGVPRAAVRRLRVERRVLPAARREVREVRRAVLGVQDEPVPGRGGRRGAVIFFFEPKRDKKKLCSTKNISPFDFVTA